MNPEHHPEPPTDLSTRSLPIVTLSKPWFRIHQTKYSPLYFGVTGENRFTAPDKEYGILYMGDDEECCFIETFGQSTGINTITTSALNKVSISRIESMRSLKFVDLTGAGLAQLGADARLTTEFPHNVARRWALALWQHPDSPDGIYYRARHDPSRFAAAIYDRAGDALQSVIVANLSSAAYAKKLGAILDNYKFGLLPD